MKQFVENSASSLVLKATNMYPIFVLIIEGLYEYVLNNLSDYGKIPENANDRVTFFKKMLNDNSNNISNDSKELIKEYLRTFNKNLITPIENQIHNELASHTDKIQELKDNIMECEELMLFYSKKIGSTYTYGKTLFKIILKYIFINTLCNIIQTSKTSLDIMDSMGDISNITDTIRAGTATGVSMTFIYLITLIVLIIMGILNKY